ncbi:MAG: AAA family ATPase [Limisphaerales bacterium]
MEAAPPYLENLPEDERTYFLSPVLRRFHNQPYHVQIAVVRLDKAAILKRYAAKLLRSQAHNRWEDEPPSVSQTQLLFRLSENVFVHLEEEGVWVYAACPTVAGQVLTTWKARFALPVKDEPPTYYLLGSGGEGVQRQPVSMTRACLHSSEDLALHYGDDFVLWEAELIQRLKSQTNGLVVLRGDPGVGKSSFLRHLIARLAKTHRVFLVPTSHFGMLTSPEMPSFWAGQNYRSKLQNLLILEDAEALLGRRDGSNDAQVSNLLNCSDGLIGDFMRVQIIATVNASLDKLDPAITRRGRLTGYRQFRRLTRCEAQRLAAAKNLTLGTGADFSLAEIYRGADSADPVPAEPTIGFRR